MSSPKICCQKEGVFEKPVKKIYSLDNRICYVQQNQFSFLRGNHFEFHIDADMEILDVGCIDICGIFLVVAIDAEQVSLFYSWPMRNLCTIPLEAIGDIQTPIHSVAISYVHGNTIEIFVGTELLVIAFEFDLTKLEINSIKSFQSSEKGNITKMIMNNESKLLFCATDDGEFFLWNTLETSLIANKTSNMSFGTITDAVYYMDYMIISYNSGHIEIISLLDFSTAQLLPPNMQGAITSSFITTNNLLLIGRATGVVEVYSIVQGFYFEFQFMSHQSPITAICVADGFIHTSDETATFKIWGVGAIEDDEPLLETIKPKVKELTKTGSFIREAHAKEWASISTQSLLLLGLQEDLQQYNPAESAAQIILDCLKSFKAIGEMKIKNTSYPTHQWRSEDDFRAYKTFVQTLPLLCQYCVTNLYNDDMLVKISGPTYIFGDIRGSYVDLEYFSALWQFGVDMTPGKYVFLGDYCNGGVHSVEVIAYLLALKILNPTQIFLLRGKDEFSFMNGDENDPLSFLNRCRALFSDSFVENGDLLWETINQCFEYLPIAALIDGKIFCCHGGIPRASEDNNTNILEKINTTARPLTSNFFLIDSSYVAVDLLWSDPATETEELTLIGSNHYAPNSERGRGIIFGKDLLDMFCEKTNCTVVVRGNQHQHHGFRVSKTGRVYTVFSSSHFMGQYNAAAVIFINDGNLNVVTTRHIASTYQPTQQTTKDFY